MKNSQTRNTYIYYFTQSAICTIFFVSCIIWLFFAFNSSDLVNIIFACAFSVIPIFAFFASLFKVSFVIYCDHNYQNYIHDVENDTDHALLIEGLQGSGKTDTAKRYAVIKADFFWQQIQSEYIRMSHEFLEKSCDKNWFEHYLEVKEVYDFYINRSELFPCLISNVPMRVDGKETLRFDFTMLLQKSRLPYKSLILLDEIKNSGLSNRYSGKICSELDESLRFLRQFSETVIVATEQNKFMALLEFRNMASNYTMQSMDTFLKPKFLLWILNKKMDKFLKKHSPVDYQEEGLTKIFPIVNDGRICFDKLYHSDTKTALRLRKFESIVNSIGFVRYVRVFRGSTQGNTVNDASENAREVEIIGRKKINRYFMPVKRRYESDTRLFRDINKAKDKSLDLSSWGNEVTIDRLYWDNLNAQIDSYAVKSKQKK